MLGADSDVTRHHAQLLPRGHVLPWSRTGPLNARGHDTALKGPQSSREMKIVYKDIDKNGAGTITVITESLEDMWHAYNLITAGDRVRASTFRKVAKETATGSTEKERKRITVTIEVKAIDFDANSGIIRLNGQNVEENQFIKVRSYLFGLDLGEN